MSELFLDKPTKSMETDALDYKQDEKKAKSYLSAFSVQSVYAVNNIGP
jgi:hypothetical protein